MHSGKYLHLFNVVVASRTTFSSLSTHDLIRLLFSAPLLVSLLFGLQPVNTSFLRGAFLAHHKCAGNHRRVVMFTYPSLSKTASARASKVQHVADTNG
jgi:hypothetical protein